jgi:RNA polymerase sigma-70 factor (ECF subfamily)
VFVDEVRQELRHRLFVVEGDGPPRIAGYSGRGPLSVWIGVAARSIALNLIRSRKGNAFAASDDDAGELPAGADPELDYLRLRYRDEFRQAFQEAIAELDQRDRMILRLCYVKGLSHDRIAVAYGVHQTTITRRISKAREALVERIQGSLRRRLDTSTVDLDSIARLLGSQLDLSLTRWLGEDDPG